MTREELETLVAVVESLSTDAAPESPSGGSCGLLGLEAALVVAYFALRPSRSRASE